MNQLPRSPQALWIFITTFLKEHGGYGEDAWALIWIAPVYHNAARRYLSGEWNVEKLIENLILLDNFSMIEFIYALDEYKKEHPGDYSCDSET